MVIRSLVHTKFSRSATFELAKKAHRHKKMTGRVVRVPKPGWAINKLVNLDPLHVEKWCHNTMRFMARRVALFGHDKAQHHMVGIDITLMGYYGKKLQDKMLKTKPKNGTLILKLT